MVRIYQDNNNVIPLLPISKRWYPEPDDWWRACDITGVADGGAITGNWTSRGINGTNADPTDDPVYRAASADMNGLPAVEFDGTNYFDCPYYTADVGTVIVIAKPSVVDAGKIFISQGDTTDNTKYMYLGIGYYLHGYWGYGQRWGSGDTADIIWGSTYMDTSIACYMYRSTGSVISGSVNGVAITQSIQSDSDHGNWWYDASATANRLVIGGQVYGALLLSLMTGLISEIVVFNRHVDMTLISRFIANLMRTYNI